MAGGTLAGVSVPLVLLVEDDLPLAGMLRAHLERDGFAVTEAHEGATALNLTSRHSPDVVVLDIGLPGLDGLEVCRTLRAKEPHPACQRRVGSAGVLTARDGEEERILGMNLGADDYVTKPFSPRELSARLKALLRRSAPPPDVVRRMVSLGNVDVDLEAHVVTIDGRDVPMTPREFDLLVHLIGSPGRVHTRESLLEQVWGDTDAGPRTVDVHVAQLRAKGVRLRTVRGLGYVADAP
ncbi:MAG TPA: response regulator transcription factor [Propionibacteriaceae bacterium]